MLLTGACLAGCGARLVRQDSDWRLDERWYSVAAIPDGRILGDGWLLKNYRKVDKRELAQVAPSEVDLEYGRRADDGRLELRAVDDAGEKTLVALCDRFLNAFRQQDQDISVGDLNATAGVNFPITVLGRVAVEGEGVEGYEAVLEQRRPGEPSPFRMVYLALARPKNSRALIAVMYANAPASFLGGFGDARSLVRRVKFSGSRQLAAEVKNFDLGAPKAFEPGIGGTTNL